MPRKLLLVLILSVVASTAAFGDITVTVYGSIGPNGQVGGSPYFDAYVMNAISALSGAPIAPVGLPSDYAIFGSASATGVYGVGSGLSTVAGVQFVTITDQTAGGSAGIPSWQGTPNPVAPYNQETGNQVMWGVAITSNLELFTLNQVLYSESFAGQVLDASTPLGAYVSDFTGPDVLAFGPSGCYGTAYGCLNGDANTQLTELYFAGLGSSLRIFLDPDRALTAEDLADWIRDVGSVEASGAYQVVPEPSSFALIGLGLVAAGLRFRRRK